MRPFWIHSGLSLLDVDDAGGLRITDDFLRAYLAREELAPLPESGPAERALHRSLQADPRRDVPDAELQSVEDGDTRENYRLFLHLRRRLLAAGTVQAAYARIFIDARQAGRIDIPPLFVDQLAHVLIHHILADCTDGLTLRMAELWFREQAVTVSEGRVVLADAEVVESRRQDPGYGSIGRLLAKGNVQPSAVDLDVIDASNAESYFGRDDRHDFAVELTVGRKSAQALADVAAAWVRHLLGVEMKIRPLGSVQDERWRWHVGLDGTASLLLDKLYRGEDLEPHEHRRLLLLLRADFVDPADQLAQAAGKPVYLGIAMDADQRLVLKPQNLLLNLPLARPLAGLPFDASGHDGSDRVH
jgi:Family of unknown function (DUF6352)